MSAPVVQRDTLTKHQMVLHKCLRILSPVSQLFNGSELTASDFNTSRIIEVPDIRVDDYIVDTQLSRIGTDHYSGSEFTGEWKNGTPPIEWRRYSTSRHRSFGYTVFNDQLKFSPFKNLPQEYLARKMQTTVLRDHDKYLLLAICLGRMTGKLVARTTADTYTSVIEDTTGISAARVACTGNQADYKWIAEPGEYTDNEVQPSFATIQGTVLNSQDPLKTLTALNVLFSDNWFDDNYGNNRFFLLTSAMEAVITDSLIEKGRYVEGGWKMDQDAKVAGTTGSSYLGTLRGWNLLKIHPEFLPKVFTTSQYVIDPNPTLTGVGTAASRTLRQVAAIAAYKESAQVHDFFANKRQEDGGTRFDGTDYVQDFSYDAWVIDQKSEGIVPIFLPDDLDGNGTTDIDYTRVNTSFNNVATALAASRAQGGTAGNGSLYPWYPGSGPDVNMSNPQWFDPRTGYAYSGNLDTNLTVQQSGDLSGNYPAAPGDVAVDVEELQAQADALANLLIATTPARTNSASVTLGASLKLSTPTSIWQVTTAGTTAAAQPSITGKEIGDTVTDGTAVLTRRY